MLLQDTVHQVHGMLADGLHRGLAEARPVEAGLAVHIGGDLQRPDQRAGAPGGHRYVVDAGEGAHAQRVQRRLLERLVPGDRGDRQ
jgi:hypothetical protein